ncbi:hypothetical protein GQ43DRAFT_243683 [Delitschia confertaspora ATCC 74209]|uniref:Uncharacterized protein n=1 Tax=Delitschia confertaspora ATCC 74209 TaxID=1513339 RepID=A0A9P4JBZ2_9PLEO|nr:hypothetical protein GQ43DRAFT_243683 [Delitschia confertaspora ATCC 74209]
MYHRDISHLFSHFKILQTSARVFTSLSFLLLLFVVLFIVSSFKSGIVTFQLNAVLPKNTGYDRSLPPLKPSSLRHSSGFSSSCVSGCVDISFRYEMAFSRIFKMYLVSGAQRQRHCPRFADFPCCRQSFKMFLDHCHDQRQHLMD